MVPETAAGHGFQGELQTFRQERDTGVRGRAAQSANCTEQWCLGKLGSITITAVYRVMPGKQLLGCIFEDYCFSIPYCCRACLDHGLVDGCDGFAQLVVLSLNFVAVLVVPLADMAEQVPERGHTMARFWWEVGAREKRNVLDRVEKHGQRPATTTSGQ